MTRNLRLFGQFELSGPDGKSVAASAKLSALLAFLAAQKKPVARDHLTTLLWGSHFEEQAGQNFRQALVRLRKALGADAIIADDQTVQLAPGTLTSDLEQFQSLAGSTAKEDLNKAAALLVGDFLEGLDLQEEAWEDWLSQERRRLSYLACSVLERLAKLELEAGKPDVALRWAEDCIRKDIFREEAHRLTIVSLASLGRKTEAIRHYQNFAERLKQELGTEPGASTTAAYETARQGKGPTDSPSAAAGLRRPSIAVLPFANLSNDPEQDYFTDGMVDEIITALSRLHWLFVIARNSSFAYKGRTVDVKQVGRELGVRYVLHGSVRRGGNRLRIAGQLVDAITGTAIWADRFEGDMADVFELQDMVTSQVVGSIAPRLEQAEIEQSRRKPTESLDAYDYFLRGQAEVHKWTLEGNRAAMAHFYKAAELDPQFATAYGMAARCYSQAKAQGWLSDPVAANAEVLRLGRHVAEFGPDDPIALSAAGMAIAYVVGDLDSGNAMIERSVEISPNFAQAWLFSGWVKAWMGEADVSISRINRALQLSPHDPAVSNMRRAIAFAYFIAGRYEEAISAAEIVSPLQQNAIFGLCTTAASAALLSRQAEAERTVVALLDVDPALRIRDLRQRFPMKRDDDFSRWEEGLRKAGLPE